MATQRTETGRPLVALDSLWDLDNLQDLFIAGWSRDNQFILLHVVSNYYKKPFTAAQIKRSVFPPEIGIRQLLDRQQQIILTKGGKISKYSASIGYYLPSRYVSLKELRLSRRLCEPTKNLGKLSSTQLEILDLYGIPKMFFYPSYNVQEILYCACTMEFFILNWQRLRGCRHTVDTMSNPNLL